MRKLMSFVALLVLGVTLVIGCKKKNDDDNNNNGGSGSASALVIRTGARTMSPDEKVTYEAVVVDSKGNATAASGVTWSVSNSLGSFSGNVFSPSNSGNGVISASVVVSGKTLTAQVPVGIYLPAVFTVVPSAIIWTTDAGTIPLTSVYLGTGTVTGYTYSSSDASIASVDGTGNVSFNKTGECVITVTANGISDNNKVYVPVLVVGMPTEPLPIVRVAVNPAGKELFRNETATFTAKAYNSSNAETSATFTWASQDESVATVDANGTVTAKSLGKTIITATASGMTGQAEVDVLPDTTIIVTPIMASIAPGGTKQFTAQAYAVNHSTKALSPIAMPAGLTWEVPTTGVPIFDIASVNSTGLVTMSSSASLGLSTVVVAHVSSPTIEEGAALVMVSDCNCGSTTPGVHHIKLTGSSTISASLMGGPVTVVAAAVDASNIPVTGATLSMCSDNMAVCTVDASNMTIVPVGPGTAVVTICNGSVSIQVTVNVTF
ncbi:hypothetical protein GCM10023093_27870 [Nemorincola caseinilytica]|uniref:BIG2 domain-containing protein n=1 Tax=Nemorincola caseinilytica TaxID=2054315 RepID=A0ABP8NPP1_9BACT